ncbi:hypothetical protein FIBSPDRAFT_932514 [Athelia psychrophila]|uniref:Uncharacterized protein n=1 Tax=Athelia psychrophila TaxID=1759441 RepID=A0A166IR52_9AGAM|nr:hypothetical protein FIBSPDRAFT_932514 [Fibularhizoctonia sp. CBS 109695]
MIGRRLTYVMLIVALWLTMLVLAVLTYIAAIASTARSDCALFNALTPESYSNITISTGRECTRMNQLSSTVYKHSSYFQSVHIIVIRVIGTLSLLVFRPSLTAMVWSALQTFTGTTGKPSLRLGAFQAGVGLSAFPDLISAALYTAESRTLPLKVTFVLLVSILSLLSPLAVSPIYRPHVGPYPVDATLNVGGGVGPDCPSTYDTYNLVPGGVSTGRALLGAGILMSIPVFPNTFNDSVAPFFSMEAMDEIWYAEVDMVVARNTVDCSASAPARLNSTAPVVALDMPNYFAPKGGFNYTYPTFLGQNLGAIPNDPQMSAVYLNSTVRVQPGSVAAETSVVFLGANSTLEGAQQTITSPTATARILFVDVLICTSTTTLETSHCVINQGNMTSCTAFVPANASAGKAGGLDAYISNPVSVAMYLAASPVTAYFSLPFCLPMYLIDNTTAASKVPPMPDLTEAIVAEEFHVPLSYIADVVFAQTAQALVQGMAQRWPVTTTKSILLIAMFATSRPGLLYHHASLDVTRLLAISRNEQLDHAFARYADLGVSVDDDLLERRIGYGWVQELGARVLVMDVSGADSHPLVEECIVGNYVQLLAGACVEEAAAAGWVHAGGCDEGDWLSRAGRGAGRVTYFSSTK